MKIKRFNNIWTMGLILVGVILVAFYIAKIAFPDFIIGVAETPQIVAFGNYVDSHLWSKYLFSFVISYCGWFFYCCACCRKYKLSFVQNAIVMATIIISITIQQFLQNMYAPFNYVMFIFIPFICVMADNNLNAKTFKSTVIVFTIDILSEALSVEIRNIVVLVPSINSATMVVLLIDTFIWRILLYLFFNYRKSEV